MIALIATDFPEIFSAVQGTEAVLYERTEPYVRRAEIRGRKFLIADAGSGCEEIAAKTALLIRRYALSAVIGTGAAVGINLKCGSVAAIGSATASGKTRPGVAYNLPDILYGDPSVTNIAIAAYPGIVLTDAGARYDAGAGAFDFTSYALYAAASLLKVPALSIKGITDDPMTESDRMCASALSLEAALKTVPLLPR